MPSRSHFFGDRFQARACRLGGGRGAESVHHIAFNCGAPAMQTCRRATIAELRARIVSIIAAAADARRSARSPPSAAARPPAAEAAALDAFLDGGDLPDDETAFLGYRFLLAAPFEAATTRRHGFAAAAAVDHVLDTARVRELRPACDDWVVWANRRLCHRLGVEGDVRIRAAICQSQSRAARRRRARRAGLGPAAGHALAAA